MTELHREWRIGVTAINAQMEGGPPQPFVMLYMPRECAKQLLALGGMVLADLPAPAPWNEP